METLYSLRGWVSPYGLGGVGVGTGGGVGRREACTVFFPVTGQHYNRGPGSWATCGHRRASGLHCAMVSQAQQYGHLAAGEVPGVEVGSYPRWGHSLLGKGGASVWVVFWNKEFSCVLGVFLFKRWEGGLFLYPPIILLQFCKTDRPTNKSDIAFLLCLTQISVWKLRDRECLIFIICSVTEQQREIFRKKPEVLLTLCMSWL